MVFSCLGEDLLSDVFDLGGRGWVILSIEYWVFMFFYIVVFLVVTVLVDVWYLLLWVSLVSSYIGCVGCLLWLFDSYPVSMLVDISLYP